MANSKQIKALLKAYSNEDHAHFYAVAMQIAAAEARHGHGKLATELRSLIDDAKADRHKSKAASPVNIAAPRGELSDLLEVSYPTTSLSKMVLSKGVKDRLHRIIKEQHHFATIRSHGLSPRRKLLLIGPPGTGKSMTAVALAGELGIPLFLVRFDRLITKFMGETAAKLSLIFDRASNTRGIYFFDEFDAIGSQRGMMNDVGEMRRILNSFLQMIERDDSNSMIIAATNHPEILDHALFRRFDDVVEYDLPSRAEAIRLLKNKLVCFVESDFDWKKVEEKFDRLSYAELSRAAEEAIKGAIIEGKKIIQVENLVDSLSERVSFSRNR